MHPEPSDLNTLVSETLAEPLAKGRIEIEIAPHLPILTLDRTRLQLLLHHLIDNALRYGGEAAKPPIVRTTIEADRILLSVGTSDRVSPASTWRSLRSPSTDRIRHAPAAAAVLA